MVWATTHSKRYPLSKSFTLVTDHKPLRKIMTTQKLTAKLARWSLLPHEHNFTVVHRAGADNSNAHSLSRHSLRATFGHPILDWSRGDCNKALASFFAMMAGVATSPLADAIEREIWEGTQVF